MFYVTSSQLPSIAVFFTSLKWDHHSYPKKPKIVKHPLIKARIVMEKIHPLYNPWIKHFEIQGGEGAKCSTLNTMLGDCFHHWEITHHKILPQWYKKKLWFCITTTTEQSHYLWTYMGMFFSVQFRNFFLLQLCCLYLSFFSLT